jgi:hypothetical protein
MARVPSVELDRGKHIESLLKWAETRVEKVLNSFALHCLKMESRCTYKILFLSFQYGNLSRDQLALLHCLETSVSQHANFFVSIHIYIYIYIQHCMCYSQFVNLILVLIKRRIKLLDQIRLIHPLLYRLTLFFILFLQIDPLLRYSQYSNFLYRIWDDQCFSGR